MNEIIFKNKLIEGKNKSHKELIFYIDLLLIYMYKKIE